MKTISIIRIHLTILGSDTNNLVVIHTLLCLHHFQSISITEISPESRTNKVPITNLHHIIFHQVNTIRKVFFQNIPSAFIVVSVCFVVACDIQNPSKIIGTLFQEVLINCFERSILFKMTSTENIPTQNKDFTFS